MPVWDCESVINISYFDEQLYRDATTKNESKLVFHTTSVPRFFMRGTDDKLGKLESSNTQTLQTRDVEAEAGSRSGGSGPFSVEAEAEVRKFYRFRFHIGYLT